MTSAAEIVTDDYKSKYGFADSTSYLDHSVKGINEEVVKEISRIRDEPAWMEDFRLRALRSFLAKPVPTWGVDLSPIHFDEFYYYAQPAKETAKKWEDVPPEIRNTFEKLGIPEAERKFLAGVGAIYESQEVYNSLQKDLQKQGVIFTSVGNAVKEYPDLIKKHLGKIVPPSDNKFAALNSAVWSDGPFIYVPEGVKIAMPLQSYFRINAQGMGQFERTLIVAEPNSEVHYIEGCTAAMYQKAMLHAAVVELSAMKGAKIRYITIQNWSKNVYNLVTKRAHAYEDASVTWLNGEVGSGRNMKYPSIYLLGKRASAEILSMAYAGANQIQDTGGKVVHLASDTSSKIISKSVSKDGGIAVYRGLLHIARGAHNVKSTVRCDALLLDEHSKTSTFPYMEVMADDATVTHEASVGKVGEDQLFYLMARGISERDALSMIVNGFVEPFTKELPMTYAIELNRLMALEMTGAVG
jgi:Fe-S cluster assembly protein SufB